MKKSRKIMGLVALCLLVFAVTAFADEGDDRRRPQKCKPVGKYDECWRFMKKGYRGPRPSYGSRCCAVLRDDSPYCICKTLTSRGSDVDLEKALEYPKACGNYKKKEEYYCAPKKYHPPPYHKSPPPPPEHKNPPPYYKSPPPPKH